MSNRFEATPRLWEAPARAGGVACSRPKNRGGVPWPRSYAICNRSGDLGIRIIRYRTATPSGHRWAIVEGDHARPLDATFATTGELIERGLHGLARGEAGLGAPVPIEELELLSPVTHPCRVIAQATNYGAHV